MHGPGGHAVRELDLISGLSGVGAYLLLRRGEPGAAAALRVVLGSLVALTGADAGGPRWRTPPGDLSPDERARYPGGYLNCGLAHGIPGPLAVLALALRAGVDLPGLPDAVARTAAWLAAHRADDPSGPTWPNAVPLPAGPGRRPAAGRRRCRRARRPGATAGPGWPPPCGWPATPSGTRPTASWPRPRCRPPWPGPTRSAGPTPPPSATARPGCWPSPPPSPGRPATPGLRRAAAAMAAGLLDRFDPAAPLGYRDLEPGGRRIDQPGLLTGAPGVALALLGATSPAEPAWARLFLLA